MSREHPNRSGRPVKTPCYWCAPGSKTKWAGGKQDMYLISSRKGVSRYFCYRCFHFSNRRPKDGKAS